MHSAADIKDGGTSPEADDAAPISIKSQAVAHLTKPGTRMRMVFLRTRAYHMALLQSATEPYVQQ